MNFPPRSRLVTFYSYKGGVGRTMAVANVAWRLANKHGLRVIAVDFDLEAPGLGRFFDLHNEVRGGVLDYLRAWRDGVTHRAPTAPEIAPWLIPIDKPPYKPAFGSLELLLAGSNSPEYEAALTDFNWQSFYAKHHGAVAIEALRAQLLQRADIVLVDSRTGLTDTGGVCTVQMPDGVFLLAAPNEQSLEGIANVARQIRDSKETQRAGRPAPTRWFVLARVSKIEEQKLAEEWVQEHKAWFDERVAEGLWSRADHVAGITSLEIPHRGRWGFGEHLVGSQFGADPRDPLSSAFDDTAAAVYRWYFGVLRLAPRGASEAGARDTEWAKAAEAALRAAEQREDVVGICRAALAFGHALRLRSEQVPEMDELQAESRKLLLRAMDAAAASRDVIVSAASVFELALNIASMRGASAKHFEQSREFLRPVREVAEQMLDARLDQLAQFELARLDGKEGLLESAAATIQSLLDTPGRDCQLLPRSLLLGELAQIRILQNQLSDARQLVAAAITAAKADGLPLDDLRSLEANIRPIDRVRPKVFISSTRDPEQLRHHLIIVGIVESFGWEAITMTRFTSETQNADRGDEEKVGECDLFVLLLGHRYGSCPPGKSLSYVELEYEAARCRSLPRLAFLIDVTAHPIRTTGPDRNVDDEPWLAKYAQLEALKARVRADPDLQPTPYTEADLPQLVLRALRLWEKKAGLVAAPAVTPAADGHAASYLARVVEASATLRLIGLPKTLAFPIRLADLYVPLHGKTSAAGGKDADRQPREDTVLLATAFRRARRDGKRGFVLFGYPGAGKTTQMRLMALICARAESGPGELDLPDGTIPAYLPLRLLHENDLHDVIGGPEHLLARALGVDLGICRALLRQERHVLYLFDGLDEVPRGLRAKVSAWIQNLHDTSERGFFAITCRQAGYFDDVKLDERLMSLELSPLREADSDAFVRKWFEVVAKHEEGQAGLPGARVAAERLIADLNKQTVAHIRLNELRANPLFLTILCLVHKNLGKHMPDARAELYEDCIQVLLDRWRVAGLATRWSPKDALRLLQPVALHLHELGLTRQPRQKLAAVLASGLNAIRSQETPQTFLDQIAEESGLFVDLGGDEFGFLHLGLQEYLAAREIRRVESEAAMRGKAAGVWRKVAEHFGEPWWEEVILMLVALDDPPTFRPFFEAVMDYAKGWHTHGRLLDECVRLGREPSAEPFARVRHDNKRAPEERAAAERLGQMIAPDINVAVRATRSTAHLKDILDFVQIPSGEFMMGDDKHEDRERPVHRVVIAQPFSLAATTVTNAQYRKFVEATGHTKPEAWNDRRFNGDDQPVVTVSWEDAQAFCAWAGLRLPSEAEWEYACRAGTTTPFSFGDTISTDQVNHDGNFPYGDGKKGEYRKRTVPVASLPANPWGLFEMHGNVLEWCEDTHQANYKNAPADGSAWVKEGARSRVLRGGSWRANARRCRAASRNGWPASDRYDFVGFRPARFTTS
jgi:formylglycine-generating enzyme required for sulfatase activity/MinD-like ATPase involved in chromosome partitioning or flagellar assembly